VSTRSGQGVDILLSVVEFDLLTHVETGLRGVKFRLGFVSACTWDKFGLTGVVGGLPLGSTDFVFGCLVLGEG